MSFDGFKKALQSHAPDTDITDQAAGTAMQNLTGFMSVLISVNEREQIIPTKSKRADYADQ